MQRVASQSSGLAEDGLRRDVKLAGDLAGARARHQAHKERQLELRLLQPIVGAEGLGAEVALAVKAAPALDAAGQMLANEEAGSSKRPAFTILPVIPAGFVRTERGLLGGDPLEHP
jgi:hypothetical protein